DRDAGLLLQTHDLGDARPELILESPLVGRDTRLAGAVGLDQRVGPWQASGLARQDLVTAVFHRDPPSVGECRECTLGVGPEAAARPQACRSYRVPSKFYGTPATRKCGPGGLGPSPQT